MSKTERVKRVEILLRIEEELWEQLMQRFPELRDVPKATAVKIMLQKLRG